jgi:flagellar biosynthesis protein FlhF
MSTLTEPHTNGHDRELGGVRTYRGRKLEDLIPQIRAELGPDAIILRQREGLMGGVGGFFAQKCVEVDAQAGPARDRNQIDIYDEDEPVNGWDDFSEDDMFDATPPPVAADPSPIEFPALPAPQEHVAPPLTPAAQDAAPAPEVAIPGPEASFPTAQDAIPAPQAAVPAPQPSVPAEGAAESFVTRLEQAAAHVDIDELVKLVTAGGLPATDQVAPQAGPIVPEPIVPEQIVPEPIVPEPIVPEAPAPVAVPVPAPVAESAPAPVAEPIAPEPTPVAAAPAPILAAPAPAALAPAAAQTPAPAPFAPAMPAPQVSAPAPAAPAPVPPAANPWVAKQAGDLDPNDAEAVAHELTSQGISDAWAQQLIVAAAAHRSPLANGSLRDAVRATLAATIPAPAPLPAGGAAIAFVGAGGAGKTRCAAALASAYAKGSTLAASVVSLGSDDWGGDLKELLKGQNVWVMGAAVGPEAAPAVQHGRDGGLVVIDTAGVTPRDPAGVEALAAELRSLSLDAVYIAVPATFSVHAARKLVEGFAALGADGIAVTHADEADQLGIAAELAHISGMPVAYIHEGLELDGALSAADPSSLAARLLP